MYRQHAERNQIEQMTYECEFVIESKNYKIKIGLYYVYMYHEQFAVYA